MKITLTILIAFSLFSCGSEKSVKRETNKSKQIVVQKFIDEYNKEYNKIQKESNNTKYLEEGNIDKLSNEFIEFINSEKNVKLAKEALIIKDELKGSQVEQLEEIIQNSLIISQNKD